MADEGDVDMREEKEFEGKEKGKKDGKRFEVKKWNAVSARCSLWKMILSTHRSLFGLGI